MDSGSDCTLFCFFSYHALSLSFLPFSPPLSSSLDDNVSGPCDERPTKTAEPSPPPLSVSLTALHPDRTRIREWLSARNPGVRPRDAVGRSSRPPEHPSPGLGVGRCLSGSLVRVDRPAPTTPRPCPPPPPPDPAPPEHPPMPTEANGKTARHLRPMRSGDPDWTCDAHPPDPTSNSRTYVTAHPPRNRDLEAEIPCPEGRIMRVVLRRREHSTTPPTEVTPNSPTNPRPMM